MANRGTKKRLQLILKYIERVNFIQSTTNLSVEKLENDIFVEGALNIALFNIGENVNHLPVELLKKYPAVPWKAIAGTRHVIAHDYEELDYAVLIDIALNHLCELEMYVNLILEMEVFES